MPSDMMGVTKQRPRVHPGAAEHYRNHDAYDRRYEGRTEDIAFYARWAGQCGSVLEYGAGTGRLTLPLAERGCTVTAVDLSESMLSGLRARLSSAKPDVRKRVTTKLADMRTFRTACRYDGVIVGFHTFCHLYHRDDVLQFLERAFAHLIPGGRLAFDVPVPRVDAAGYDALSQVCVVEMDGAQGPELLTQRWYQPQELRMHLMFAGFEKVRFLADFTFNQPDEDTDFLVVEARRPAC